MKYVSIDIETTGLNPKTCQIIEFGAVTNSGEEFHRYIRHDKIIGELHAITMNQAILSKLEEYGTDPKALAWEFREFLDTCGFDSKINVAGKNYAGFDAKFLSKIHNWDWRINTRLRVLDPAILYYRPGDTKLPDLQTCMKRAGMEGVVPHNAVEDARIVKELIGRKFDAKDRSDKEVSDGQDRTRSCCIV